MKKRIILLCCILLCGCSASKEETPKKETKKEVEEKVLNVSFLAAGDNLIHSSIYDSNKTGDNSYDFNNIYTNTNALTQSVDVAYLNQETICAGEELGLSNYPAFNAPYEVLDAAVNAGFDWISTSSNHSLDRGEQGIINEHEYLSKYQDIFVTGTHPTQEDANDLQVINKNGMKIGILGYTYGLNGYMLPEDKPYLVDLIDKEKIKADMKRLKKVSDVQIVSMHWGQENQFVQNSEQEELAQYLSDIGVDVIIGCHPHVIQPMDYVQSKDGNETLVIYSMGNFLSAMAENNNLLGGLPMWNIEYNTKSEKVSFKDVKFVPTVTYIKYGGGTNDVYRTYTLKDYNNTLSASQWLTTTQNQDTTKEYYISLVNEVMGDKVPLDY